MTDWLTIRQLSQRFGISPDRVRNTLKREPGIPTRRSAINSRLILVAVDDFRRFALGARGRG